MSEITNHSTRQVDRNSTPPARPWQSVGAILLGFFAVVVLSLGTDQIFHMLDVYPPWGVPMQAPGLNLLALSYRTVYAILGSYLAARFAPRNPMRHAVILGFIGLVPATGGAIAAISADL